MERLISLVISAVIMIIPLITGTQALANNVNFSATTVESEEFTTVVDSNGQTVTAGILPDSPFSWFEELMDKLQWALTLEPVKKAHLKEQQALEELAEAQQMAKKGKLAEALNQTQAANITVLTGLLDKIPPQAAKKVALNVVRSMERLVERQTSALDQEMDNSDHNQDKNNHKSKKETTFQSNDNINQNQRNDTLDKSEHSNLNNSVGSGKKPKPLRQRS
jgi:hypothetical protein